MPPWDRMWPFRAGRLLNSFRQMEHVSLLLASICSPNTAFGWPLLQRRDRQTGHVCEEGEWIYPGPHTRQQTHFIHSVLPYPRPQLYLPNTLQRAKPNLQMENRPKSGKGLVQSHARVEQNVLLRPRPQVLVFPSYSGLLLPF